MVAGMAGKWYRYIFKENIYGVGIQAATFLAGIIFTVVFPNVLGRDGFGYLSLVIGFVTIGQVFTDLGIQTATLRLIPDGSKIGIAWKYFRLFLKWKLILSLAFSAALFFGAETLASVYHSPELVPGIQAGALFFFFFSMNGFLDAVFIAAKKTRNSFIMIFIFNSLRILIPLAIFVTLSRDYADAVWGIGVACGLAVIPALFIALRDPLLNKGKEGPLDYPALKGYLSYGTLWYVALLAIQWSDLLIVGLFRPVSDVSLYRVAWLWATATSFLFPFSQRVFLSVHAYEDEGRSKAMFDLMLKYGFVFAFLMMAGILLVSGQFLQIVYGQEYADAYPIVAILSLLTLEITLTTISTSLFTGKGKITIPACMSIGAAVFQVILLFALTPQFGLLGAATAVAIARILFAVLHTAIAARYLTLRIPTSYIGKPGLCGALAVALLLPVKQYTFNLPSAFAYGVGVVLVYCTLAVALKAVDLKEIARILRGVSS